MKKIHFHDCTKGFIVCSTVAVDPRWTTDLTKITCKQCKYFLVLQNIKASK